MVDIWVQAGRPVEITFVIWGPWEYDGDAGLGMEISADRCVINPNASSTNALSSLSLR